MSSLLLDRHVLASNATTWDTAWGTFGWTPALEGVRASRLEEEVPWGTRTGRLADPPRLSGPLDAVMAPANLARLGRALLAVDGRLGFSLWGAVGDEKVGSEWRVATHTVLLDEDDFRALAGHPDGLLAPGGDAAPWLRELAAGPELREPSVLEPVRVALGPDARDAFAADRLAALRRLRAAVLAARGGDANGLAADLADLYEALAAALAGRSLRYVALPVEADGEGRDLLRLVWLSLPLEDRLRVHYVTEQRRAERPPGHLLGLPTEEWGRFVPEDGWVLGGDDPVGPVSPGRRHWAELVAADDDLSAFAAEDRRASLRGWQVVVADDLRRVGEHARWRAAWDRTGPTAEAIDELARREAGRSGGPRAAAVGVAAGRAVAAGAMDAVDVAGVAADFDPEDGARMTAGAVRALVRAGRAADAGFVRAIVTEALGGQGGQGERGDQSQQIEQTGPLVRALRRFVDRESAALRALLLRSDGPAALVRAAFSGAAGGDGVALELARVAVAEGRWDADAGARLAGALPVDVPGGDGAAVELLLAQARDGTDADSVRAVAEPLVDRIPPAAVADLARRLPDVADAAVDVADGGDSAGAAGGIGDAGRARDAHRVAALDRLEALRRAALRRLAAAGTGELDDAAVALVALGGRTAPPGTTPEPWRALIGDAPAHWLSRGPVLAALADVLGAGRRPWGAAAARPGASAGSDAPTPAVPADVASLLARRVLERAGPASLDRERLGSILRLVWLEGDGATLRWLVGTRPDASAALLARMLVVPAPLPLAPLVRDALDEALATGADRIGLEPFGEELAMWAPALHERAGLLATAGERFVPLAATVAATVDAGAGRW